MQMIIFNDSSGLQQVASEDQPFPVTGSLSLGAENANTTVTDEVRTIGATDTSVLAANATRKGAFVTNISDETIWVAFGKTAVQGAVMPVVANGSLPVSVDGVVWRGTVRAICASGSKSLYVIEV